MSLLSFLRQLFRRRPAPNPIPPAPVPPAPNPDPDFASTALSLVNSERAARRLRPLAADARLDRAAQGHSDRMAAAQTLQHTLRGEPSFSARITAEGVRYRLASENIFAGWRPGADAAITAWMESPDHAGNILGGTAMVGFGRAVGTDGRWYWTADFASE